MPKFGWKAVYEGGVVRQYPVGRPETNFREVVSRGLPIRFFVGTRYGVNLQTGELLIKGRWQRLGDADGNPLVPTELVYFRRHMVTANIDPAVKVQGHQIWHFVGFKHSKGQVRLCIPDDGSAPIVCVEG